MSGIRNPNMSYTYEYERPAVTVDALLLGLMDDALNVLLIKRGNYPYEGKWALPGGFVDMDENLEDAAARELREETGVSGVALKQFRAFGDVGRDPRSRNISVIYHALVKPDEVALKPGDDASDARWFPAYDLPDTAFDHDMIIGMMLDRLRFEVRHTLAVFDLLPEVFTMEQLAGALGACLNKKVSPRIVKERMAELGIAVEGKKGTYRIDREAARQKSETMGFFPL